MSEDSTVLSALLDYYSDKASAEASAVVATTFGLFVILTVQVASPWKFLIYWVLWVAGFYFLMGFGFWADHANWAKLWLTKAWSTDEKMPKDRIIEQGVRLKWRKTFLRNFYYKVKYGQKLTSEKWVARQEAVFFKPSDLIHTGFFIFGWLLSCIFFPGDILSFYGVPLSFVLWGAFIFDVFSITRHRRFARR